MNSSILNYCNYIVKNCNVKILIAKLWDNYHIFVCENVSLKSRECPYTDVFDAIDITSLVEEHTQMVKTWDADTLKEKTRGLPSITFKFGSDDFIRIIKVQENF